jgi:hypothetical protein
MEGVDFQPFFVYFNKFQIFVYNVESSNREGCEGAGCGFISSFVNKKALYEQKILENFCVVHIFEEFSEKQVFRGKTPNEVWNKINIFPIFDGKSLFGLMDEKTQQIIKNKSQPTCQPKDWAERSKLEPLYSRYLKHQTYVNIQCYQIFLDWYDQISDIIELKSALKNIYASDHTLKPRELRAWRTLLKAAGCFNITPYPLNEELVIFIFCNEFIFPTIYINVKLK